MKIAGFLLLVAGWLLVLAALAMLPSGVPRNAFMAAGMAVEATGLAIAAREHPARGDRK